MSSSHCGTIKQRNSICIFAPPAPTASTNSMSSNRNLTRGLMLSDRSLTSIAASKDSVKEGDEAVHANLDRAPSSQCPGMMSTGPEASCKEEAEGVDIFDCHGPSSFGPLPHRGRFNIAPLRMPVRQRTYEELPPPPPPSAPAMGYGHFFSGGREGGSPPKLPLRSPQRYEQNIFEG
jgi:hypothetical protein